MSATVEIADRLRAERQRCNLRSAELAEAAGVSKTTQINYENGTRAPDANYLAAAAKVGLDVLFVVTGVRSTAIADEPGEFIGVPVLPVEAAAGSGVVNDHQAHYQVPALSFSRQWITHRGLTPANLCIITVRGGSMDGVLSDGDLVLINMGDTHPRSGFVYVLRQGHELLVKYCQLLPGGILRVSSANPAYQSYDVDLAKTNDVQVVGRVVASMREW